MVILTETIEKRQFEIPPMPQTLDHPPPPPGVRKHEPHAAAVLRGRVVSVDEISVLGGLRRRTPDGRVVEENPSARRHGPGGVQRHLEDLAAAADDGRGVLRPAGDVDGLVRVFHFEAVGAVGIAGCF